MLTMMNEKKAPEREGQVIFDAALAMALDKVGGAISYTEAEYHAMRARRGRHKITTSIDKTVDPPVITVSIVPAPAKPGDPIM